MAENERTRHVIVIGSGVIGLAVGAAAADDGCRVTVLEANGVVCAGASAASFAWANAHDKHPADYAALRRLGIDRHARLSAARRPGERWYHPLPSRVAQEAVADGGAVDVAVFARAHVAVIEASGGTIRTEAPAARIEAGRTRPSVTLVSGEVIAADHIVIAAGTGSAALLRDSALRAPVLGTGSGSRGFVVRVRTGAPPTSIEMTDALSLRPEGDGALLQSLEVERRLTGAGVRATPALVWTEIRDRAADSGLVLRDDDMVEVREAARPVALDGLPVVGEVAASVHLVVAHSGVTLAPILGELVAAELRGEVRAELEPYRPSRPISP